MKKKKIILCSGDPAGIGIELCLKLIEANIFSELIFIHKIEIDILGNINIFQKYIDLFCPSLKIIKEEKNYYIYNVIHQKKWKFLHVELFQEKIKLQSKENFLEKLLKVSGKYSYKFLIKTTEYLKRKKYQAVVTAPIHKERVSLQNKISFYGYTFFFKEEFQSKKCSMCFTSTFFDLVLITSHIPLSEISKHIHRDSIQLAIKNAVELQKINGCQLPIAFMGMNPHAGENGQIGIEDLLIKKEIQYYLKENSFFKIEGPLPADSAFIQVAKKKYRTVICCYHDQGLIPLKMLSNFCAVNVSLGLPFVRTSPAHGTADDIAWKGHLCDPESFFEAVKKSIELLVN